MFLKILLPFLYQEKMLLMSSVDFSLSTSFLYLFVAAIPAVAVVGAVVC